MATIKSHTSLEQSRKLAEILPLETADMYWFEGEPFVEAVTGYNEERAESHRQAGMEMYPCWSLTALLEVLPNGIVMNKDCENGNYHFSSAHIGTYVTADNPIDACVVMIEKLHELKKL